MPIKKIETTLIVINNSVNSTVVGMLEPLLKTHASSSILEPTAKNPLSHSCHSTAKIRVYVKIQNGRYTQAST